MDLNRACFSYNSATVCTVVVFFTSEWNTVMSENAKSLSDLRVMGPFFMSFNNVMKLFHHLGHTLLSQDSNGHTCSSVFCHLSVSEHCTL